MSFLREALAWPCGIIFFPKDLLYGKLVIKNLEISNSVVSFMLGAVSSFAAAFLVLPKRKIQADEGIETRINYPSRRVLIGLSLSPMVSGIFFLS